MGDDDKDSTFEREREIFFAALEKKTEGSRAEYLRETCGDDAAMLARVREMLERHHGDETETFLKPQDIPQLPGRLMECEGDTVGNYKLVEKLGEGGFGVVWMAEQEEPVKRKVALKLIKPGMDSAEVIARFGAERQALAVMDHPNIAKVFDAGATESGRPYFVMELADGVPVTEFCDREKLTTKERLELFIEVCKAVQHAHQKGIIHRDIKPNNVLVGMLEGKPAPKVIDFGIAKATQQELTEMTMLTQQGQFVGTPAYMSPEQAQMTGNDIDTRSDIYSLGVLLYELLTGKTPFEPSKLLKAGFDEIRRVIAEDDPPRPSTRLSGLGDKELTDLASLHQSEPRRLGRSVRGDLDWVVMKALEKDRERRYETANGFAADLRRYLDQEPVTAGPPGIGYKMGKFVRRNRSAVAVAAVITLLLVAGIAVSSWLAVVATEAKGELQVQLGETKKAQKVADDQRDVAEERLQRIQLREAEYQLEQGEVTSAIVSLARVIRDHPSNGVAAERLVSCLIHRNFPQSLGEPMRHEDRVNSAQFSPDGARVVTASADGTARIWDAVTGQPLGGPMRHESVVHSAQFSPDGERVVTAFGDDTARIWDAATGQPLGEPMRHGDLVRSAQFSPDGGRVVTASKDKTARIWDAVTGEPLGEPMHHGGYVLSAQFSPDGGRVVTAGKGGNKAQIWDADTGEPLGEPLRHQNYVASAQFSSDGRRVVTASWDNTARIWDAFTGEPQGEPMRHDWFVHSAQFSPDGGRVVTASKDGTARIWDGVTGEPLGEPMRHRNNMLISMQLSPEGHHVVTISKDGIARIWDAVTGELLGEPMPNVRSAQFSPNGRRVVIASYDNTARIWDAFTGERMGVPLRHGEEVTFAQFSPDGGRIVTAASHDKTARIWNAVTGQPLGKPMRHEHHVGSSPRFSPDGRRIVTASNDMTARIWDAFTGQPLGKPMRHGHWVTTAQFSPDGGRVVTAGGDKTARVWDAVTGQPLGEPMRHGGWVTTAQFSPDGERIVTASSDKTARIWDADTRRPIGKPMSHGGKVRSAQFSPDGRRVVTASDDKTARIWDAFTGERMGELMRHGGWVTTAQFSPDGARVVTASNDMTARIWDAFTGQPLGKPMRHGHWVTTAQFSPDGSRVATASDDNTARIWDAFTGHSLGEPMRHGDIVRSARFSSDGRRVVTASHDKTARIWDTPRAPLPAPLWLAEWAEAVAGRQLSADGTPEDVPPEESFKIRQQVLSSSDTDFYTTAAKWFFADRALRATSPWRPPARENADEIPEDALPIADFEGEGYMDWKVTGSAFSDRPPEIKRRITGYRGRQLVDTHPIGEGEEAVGTLTSPAFTLERKHLSFLIGGGNHPGETCINLLVGGEVARSATGTSTTDSEQRETMEWASWEVSEFEEMEVQIEIVDRHTGGWGHLLIDHIIQSDSPMAEPLVKLVTGRWVDMKGNQIGIRQKGAEVIATSGCPAWDRALGTLKGSSITMTHFKDDVRRVTHVGHVTDDGSRIDWDQGNHWKLIQERSPPDSPAEPATLSAPASPPDASGMRSWRIRGGKVDADGMKLAAAPGRLRTVKNGNFLRVDANTAVRVEFDLDRLPESADLQFQYLSTEVTQADGKMIEDTPLEIRLNGKIIATDHQPKRGESFDVSGMLEIGPNELTIRVLPAARAALWLQGIGLTFGDGTRPNPDKTRDGETVE